MVWLSWFRFNYGYGHCISFCSTTPLLSHFSNILSNGCEPYLKCRNMHVCWRPWLIFPLWPTTLYLQLYISVRCNFAPFILWFVFSLTYSHDSHHLYATLSNGSVIIWEGSAAKGASKTPKFLNLTTLVQ